ncbi:MAG: DUF6323 family protein [Oscillospiraceae bacterium]|nr:DUF6323 family protein [Oscillospiraceae bacterium]
MSLELSLFNSAFNSALATKQAAREIMRCNDFTALHGLTLTEQQSLELVETRNQSLRDSGRIEIGGGVTRRLIYEFCDSPYISMQNYAETLHELTELFYYFKTETNDLISDDDLISYMKNSFDNVCQGSLDMLAGTELDRMARNLRNGHEPDYEEPEDDGESGEDGFMAGLTFYE